MNATLRLAIVGLFGCGLAPWAQAQTIAPPPGSIPTPLPFVPVRPSGIWAFGPYDLLAGYARITTTTPQPTGHEIIPTGPNGYVYRPVYDAPTGPLVPPAPPSPPGTASPVNVEARVAEAVAAFRSGQYETVVRQTEQLLVGDPRQGFAQLLQMHAYFALGKFTEASDSLHRALWILPEAQWGQILSEYRDYYRATRYTDHLRALEQFVSQQPNQPAGQFLLGYHAGYLGYVPEAAKHFAAALELAQVDELAARLLRKFGGDGRARPAAEEIPAPRVERGPREF